MFSTFETMRAWAAAPCVLLAALVLMAAPQLGGCASTLKPPPGGKKPAKLEDISPQKKTAASAVEALRAGKFAAAEKAAATLLEAQPANVFGHLVRAIAQYKKTMHQLSTDLRTVLFGALRAGGINHRYMRSALAQTEKELGIVAADQARWAYLAKTDDDREWVPNPRQKNHPLPLPVDEALYATWKSVVGDVERLVRGEEGLSVEALAQLGDHKWKKPPKGLIDLGGMLSKPKDIVFDIRDLLRLCRARDVEGMLKSILGDGYVPKMKPSPIIGRLTRMKAEVKRGKETFQRKRRYLLWLN